MDLISFILCALFIFIILIIPTIYRQYVIRRKLKNISQCGGFPFGVALEMIKMTNYERIQWFKQRALQFKKGIFVYWVGLDPFISIYKPEYIETILPSTVNIEKGEAYKLLHSWLGMGLLTSTGKQWFHDRRLIGPTFHFSILDQFAIVMSEKAEILTKCLEKEIAKNPGEAIDIFPFINNVALDVICETAMGVDVHAQEVQTTYTTTIHKNSVLILKRLFQPWLWSDWLYHLMPAGKEYKLAVNRLHTFTRDVIRKRKIARESQNGYVKSENEDDEEVDIGKRKRKAFLDLLLDQNEKDEVPLTDDEVRAQVDTFMFERIRSNALVCTDCECI